MHDRRAQRPEPLLYVRLILELHVPGPGAAEPAAAAANQRHAPEGERTEHRSLRRLLRRPRRSLRGVPQGGLLTQLLRGERVAKSGQDLGVDAAAIAVDPVGGGKRRDGIGLDLPLDLRLHLGSAPFVEEVVVQPVLIRGEVRELEKVFHDPVLVSLGVGVDCGGDPPRADPLDKLHQLDKRGVFAVRHRIDTSPTVVLDPRLVRRRELGRDVRANRARAAFGNFDRHSRLSLLRLGFPALRLLLRRLLLHPYNFALNLPERVPRVRRAGPPIDCHHRGPGPGVRPPRRSERHRGGVPREPGVRIDVVAKESAHVIVHRPAAHGHDPHQRRRFARR
mmetsp:Transcript_2119/g.8244  ORF Transcript_2119/g.8244 Transcript_2119/m.8244 type:complete len:336 (-) Transcript_2119:238-1245(-)